MSDTTARPGDPANDFVAHLSIRLEKQADDEWIEALHERCFGPGRFARAAYRVREQIDPDPALCFCAEYDGQPVSTVRLTRIAVGIERGFLLGPLATDPAFRSRGAGRYLVRHATDVALTGGEGEFVLLVGDAPYYQPAGYRQVRPGSVSFPGPVDPARILIHCPDGLHDRLEGAVEARRM